MLRDDIRRCSQVRLVLACFLMACGGSTAPETRQEQASVSEEPATDLTSPRPADEEVERALAVYAGLRAAYRAGDRSRYAAYYAERLTCFYNTANVSREDVLAARSAVLEQERTPTNDPQIHSLRIDVVSQDTDLIILHDWGWTGGGGNSTGTVFHAKRLGLRRQQGEWQIISESSIEAACGQPATARPAPPEWLHLKEAYRSMIDLCEEGPDAPGLGGSNGCDCGMNMMNAEDYCRAHFQCDGLELSGPCLDRRLEDCIAGPGHEIERFCE